MYTTVYNAEHVTLISSSRDAPCHSCCLYPNPVSHDLTISHTCPGLAICCAG